MSGPKTKRIAELNDQLRSRVGMPAFGASVPGKGLMTSGIMALSPETIIHIWAAVRNHSEFTPDNDPYGEHDFGCVDIHSAGKVFWKVDYYHDENCDAGCEDPSDLDKSYRILTIMLAEEY